MPSRNREKTRYPGVYYVIGTGADGKPERVYYIVYRRDGKLIEEKAGYQGRDDMTEARAARLRAERIDGKSDSNKIRRNKIKAEKQADDNRWTLSKLWAEYKKSKVDFKGIKTDESRFKRYLEIPFGHKEPEEIAPLDVDRVRVIMLKSKSPQTVKNTLELFRRIINFGVKMHLCSRLPFTIEFPKPDNHKTEDLTPAEMERLFKAIAEDTNIQAAGIMKAALFTGMRRGEIFKLKWSDLDFDKGFIFIRNPKGGKDQRIPMNEAARQLFLDHPRTGSEFVFPGRNGGLRKDVKHQTARIKRRAGLPEDFRALHGLRHVYASMLASSGQVDIYTLQKLLTHKSPQMTQRYAHLRDEALKRAAEVAGNLFANIEKQNTSIDVENPKTA